MYYKALLHETYTKRDVYGNVYHVVKITNPKNGKSFTTETPSMSNVISILNRIFTYHNCYITESCTGSTKLSSLPSHVYLDNCHPNDEWYKALRGIGYRIPKGNQ